MSTRAFSEINLHITWHVKESLPIINETIEPRLHHYLRNYALQTKGLIFHEAGGTETHIHIAVTIPPTLLISEWIGRLIAEIIHAPESEDVRRKVQAAVSELTAKFPLYAKRLKRRESEHEVIGAD